MKTRKFFKNKPTNINERRMQMDKHNNLDELPLAKLNEDDLNRVKALEQELTNKYESSIVLMALRKQ